MTNENTVLPHIRLMLHAKAPNIEDCWLNGYEAFAADKDESDNPYPAGTPSFKYWAEGWCSACYGEEPLFKDELESIPLVSEQASVNTSAETAKEATNDNWLIRTVRVGFALLFALLCYELADMAI